jgi:predicted amino acid-binding ACT domain protein
MAKAKKVKQLSFMMPDRAGLLSEVTTALAGAKVNIKAICAYGMQGEATFMLTADSNAKAKKALAPLAANI